MSLITDVWTGITPVVLHHNAHRSGKNILRETWWPETCFQKRLRVLFDASGVETTGYVAVGEPDGREYWPEKLLSGGHGKKNAARGYRSSRWLQYHDVCGEYDQELSQEGCGWV